MNEKDLDQNNAPADETPEMHSNDYGATLDDAVVVDEADRTVLLTKDETLIIEREPRIDVVPTNRPRKVYGGMWGQAEIATVALAMLAILTMVLLYVFLVIPSNRELEANQLKRDRLEAELASARTKYGDITSTETQVAKLIASVDEFESRYLPIIATGQTALYQKINGLIAGYGLVNTTGPDFAPLDIDDGNRSGESDSERGRAKFKSLFPGIYVSMTVEGSYHNLRRFIREIETGNEFVVISAVELEPSDSQGGGNAPVATTPSQSQIASPTGPIMGRPNGFAAVNDPTGLPQPQQPARPRGTTHGETVTLRLEMAAYFRRPNAIPPADVDAIQ